MATYKALKEQAEALARRIEEARLIEVQSVIANIRELAAEYRLSAEDVFGHTRSKRSTRGTSSANVKYRDPLTGAGWSGRGRPPDWIKGKDRNRFLV
jgi:DNA-binding protein H-NS